MKKFLLTLLLTLSSAVAFAFSGSGTEADPYLIKTADDLYLVRTSPYSYYKLANDIDLTEWIADNYPKAGWAPICSREVPFSGTLDGNSHTISNLFINRTTYYIALIAYAVDATIKNLHVVCDIAGGDDTAAIIGDGSGNTICDCLVEGRISGGNHTGGVAGGSYYNTLQRCVVEADISGQYIVGGIIGESGTNDRVYDCYYEGNISAIESIGGIVGRAYGDIKRCLTKGTISGNGYIGGIVGFQYGGNIESNVCLCTSIKGVYGVGRICGEIGASIGTFGSKAENRVVSDCQVYLNDNLQDTQDSRENGYAVASTALQRALTYTAITWDFSDIWGIDEGISFPYLRFRKALQSETTTDPEEYTSFDFTLPAHLSPSVTPADEEDAGVNVTTNTFCSDNVTISFGLGTRTQSFSARLWTNEDFSYGLRLYKDGTMTVSTSDNTLITRIDFTGEDVSALTPSEGTISGGTWTGEAQSVTFTIGAACNKINTIAVAIKYDVLALTDATPAIHVGSYEPGKVKYDRICGGEYASFCLPFDVGLSAAEGIEKVYMPMEQILYNTQTQYLMMFLKEQDMTSTVEAGTPFLAKIADANVSFSNVKRVSYSEPLTSNPTAKALTVFDFDGKSGVLYQNNTLNVTWGGTFVATAATTGLNSFNINGSFGQHSGTLSPYRAYVMQTAKSGANSNVRGIQLNLGDDEGEVTSIFQLLNAPAATESIYDMQGRRVLNPQQGGLYIINGKKVRL